VGLDHDSVRTGVDGVFNVLEYYGFLDGGVDVAPQTRVTGFDQYSSPVGGLVDFDADLGDDVEAGDVLFTVTDVFGEHRASVEAEEDGVFWRRRRLPQVATGEYVCSVGTEVDQY
jgi:predicted deacylase